jgi:hypothetical protein
MKTLTLIEWMLLTLGIAVLMITATAALGYIPDMGKLKWETKQLDTYLKVKNRQMPKQ